MTLSLSVCQLWSEAKFRYRDWCIITIEILATLHSLINFKYKCTKFLIIFNSSIASWSSSSSSRFRVLVPGSSILKQNNSVKCTYVSAFVRVCSYARILAIHRSHTLHIHKYIEQKHSQVRRLEPTTGARRWIFKQKLFLFCVIF
jgi:hypothetical protein